MKNFPPKFLNYLDMVSEHQVLTGKTISMANTGLTWKIALTGTTTEETTSRESTVSTNLNSTISFNGYEGSNSLHLTIHRLNGRNYMEWAQSV